MLDSVRSWVCVRTDTQQIMTTDYLLAGPIGDGHLWSISPDWMTWTSDLDEVRVAPADATQYCHPDQPTFGSPDAQYWRYCTADNALLDGYAAYVAPPTPPGAPDYGTDTDGDGMPDIMDADPLDPNVQ